MGLVVWCCSCVFVIFAILVSQGTLKVPWRPSTVAYSFIFSFIPLLSFLNLSKVARLHTEYGVRRSKFYERHPDDRRLREKFASSRREKERVKQTLNVVSKQVVEKAVKNREAIVLERLKGIKKAH
jgi:hypothetical protein